MNDIPWQMKNCDSASQFCLGVISVFFLRMSFHILTKEGGQIGGQVQDLIDRDGATIGQWLLTLKRKSNR
jgi:hypothetical protein